MRRAGQMRPKCSPALRPRCRSTQREPGRATAQMRPKCSPARRQMRPKFPGSTPPRASAAVYRDAITEKLDAGLSAQRIWQDLVEEFGYGASYESVKRFVRTLAPRPRAVG